MLGAALLLVAASARAAPPKKPARPAPILAARASADGRRLVLIEARSAKLYSLETGALLAVTTGDYAGASQFDLSASGRWLAFLRRGNLVDVKDLRGGRDWGTFQWNLLDASALSLCGDGSTLATANGSSLQLWDRAALRAVAATRAPGVRRMWLGPDKRLLLLAQDGSLRQWDGARDRWTDWPARPGCGPPRVELSAGRDFAAVERSCGGKPLVCVRRIEDGALLARQALPGGARLYAVSRDGKRLLALEGRRLSEYAVPGGAVARSWLLPAGVRPVFPPLLDPSWRWLAARRSGRLLRLDLSGPVASLRVLPGGG